MTTLDAREVARERSGRMARGGRGTKGGMKRLTRVGEAIKAGVGEGVGMAIDGRAEVEATEEGRVASP